MSQHYKNYATQSNSCRLSQSNKTYENVCKTCNECVYVPSKNLTQPIFLHFDVRVCQLQQKMLVLARSTFVHVPVPVPSTTRRDAYKAEYNVHQFQLHVGH